MLKRFLSCIRAMDVQLNGITVQNHVHIANALSATAIQGI